MIIIITTFLLKVPTISLKAEVNEFFGVLLEKVDSYL